MTNLDSKYNGSVSSMSLVYTLLSDRIFDIIKCYLLLKSNNYVMANDNDQQDFTVPNLCDWKW